MFLGAVGAISRDDVIDGERYIFVRQRGFRHRDVGKAEGLAAVHAMKMGMPVVGVVMIIIAHARLVARGARSVVDSMHQMMSLEEGECAEDGTLVGRIEGILQVAETERGVSIRQSAQHQQAHCRSPYAVRLEA